MISTATALLPVLCSCDRRELQQQRETVAAEEAGENDPVLVAKYMCNVEGIGSICIGLIRFDKAACSPSWTKMLK